MPMPRVSPRCTSAPRATSCGTVLVLSLGTGIGSALFVDGKLVPNTELGHLEFDGMEAEARASGRARMERKLDWTAYMTELNYVLNRMHALFWPDLIVLCGGITADHPNLCDDLKRPAPAQAGRVARRCRHRRRGVRHHARAGRVDRQAKVAGK